MSNSIEKWAHFFKPEVRKQGDALFAKGAVNLAVASDNQIQAYVRAGTGAKVSFACASIAVVSFVAECSCSSSSRGQLCKHIWATLSKVDEAYPDFLDAKIDIEKGHSSSFSAHKVAPKKTEIQENAEAQLKLRQSEYRKQQYQNQKQRLKEQRNEKKTGLKTSQNTLSKSAATLSNEVKAAYSYFSSNGFPMSNPVDEEALRDAKKKLSRVFHPDKGGTHDEILELNGNFEVLLEYLHS